MAIFMNDSKRLGALVMREVGDKMYISGQAHTSDSFKPLYGDYLYSFGGPTNYLMSGNTNSFHGLNFNGGLATATYNSGITNSYVGQNCGGLTLRTSLKSIDGYTYVVAPHGIDNHSSALSKTTDTGEVVQVGGSSYTQDPFILFENNTHIFIASFGPTFLQSTTSLAAYLPTLQAVDKATMSANAILGSNAANKKRGGDQMYPASTTSSTAGTQDRYFLLELDESNKKATIARVITNNLGGVASSAVYFLDGNTGIGAYTIKTVTFSNTVVTASGNTTSYKPKAGFDYSKAITGTDGKKYAYRFDLFSSTTAYFTESERNLQVLSWDVDSSSNAVEETVAISTSLPSAYYCASLRNSVRVIERANHFYVYLIFGMTLRSTVNTGLGRIVTYKGSYDNPKELTEVSNVQINPNASCTGFLPLNSDGTQLMLEFRGGFPEIYHWDEAQESFVHKATLPTNIKSAMVDSLNRLWYIDSADAIHIQGPSVGHTVRIAFKDNNLEYAGVQINSEIAVSCFNVNGERVANNVALHLEGGAAVFSSNNSDSAVTMTSTTNDVMVPFVVNRNGYIRVIANMAV